MTNVIGLPLTYMLHMGAEIKNCALPLITCTNHISTTPEATSVTLQISTKAVSLMKTSGMVILMQMVFFFNIFSRTSRHLCNSYYLCYFLLVSHDHLPSAIYRKWLDQSSMSVRSKYSITCNEHSFMWCNINTTCNIKNSGPRSYMHLFISFLVRSNTKMCELFSSSYLIS